MALEPLASVADLRERTTAGDDALAARMLAAASSAVRDAAGTPISLTTSTVTIEGGRDRRLMLPGQPVVSVSSVSVDGEALSADSYRLVSGALWRSCGWATCGPSLVTVTFTHGLATVPDDIVELVCDFAIAGLLNAGEGAKPGVVGEAIDDYRVTYSDDGAVPTFTIPKPTRLMLASRFGSGAHVTGWQEQ